MSIIQGNVLGGVEGAYQIERSLRFNSADSAYLSRTPASAGNRKTWTWSGWVKRSGLGSYSPVFSAGTNSSTAIDSLAFTSGDVLEWYSYSGGGYNYRRTSTQVFRDPSAYFHLMIVLDTTLATADDRAKVFVNGSQVTAFANTTNPTQNSDGAFVNNTNLHAIGRDLNDSALFNGYLTEINFIDGSALTPSSFGEFNTDTGVWQPKAYTGSYGTNGFYLNFSDNASTTTLGDDFSGNGNDWTTNNFSVTAGAGNDSLVDTPTNYGTDTGVGGEVRGNYCTLNPLSKSTSSGTTPTNGNLDIAATATACDYMTTMFVSSGKWYFEVLVNQDDTSTPSGNPTIGIYGQGFPASGPQVAVDTSGALTVDGSVTGSGFFTYTTGNLIGVAFDMDAKKAWFSEDGVYYNSGDPAAGTNATGTWSAAGEVAAYIRTRGNASASFNAGQRPFAYTAPSGFKALCTQNLPTPTIEDGGEYFNTVLYTGTGSSLGVTGVGFQPDWVWIKERSGAADHGLYDVARGVQKQLESNNLDAETTESTGLTAFGSDGFTVGSLAQLNTNNDTYVAWNWANGGASTSNTDGTISSTVRVNTTAGFSIVSYAGSSASTVGHGLGVAPSMIIAKQKDAVEHWVIYHVSTGKDAVLLFTTSAVIASANYWGSGGVTSTVFGTGGVGAGNAANNIVAYCFAAIPGYSAFGSYLGNGSADGPFVYTGFRPAFVMWKNTSAAEAWLIEDAARSPYNQVALELYPSSSGAEAAGSSRSPTQQFDFLSNGFKVRGAQEQTNGSGNTIIYMAFAENPFKYSLAR